MAAKKIQAIKDFIAGLAALRQKVKEDSAKMLEGVTLEVLADPEALADFLDELVTTAGRRHLIDDRGKVRPEAARLIRRYVKGMLT